MSFRWREPPARAAARHDVLPLQGVLVQAWYQHVHQEGKKSQLLPRVVELWWGWAPLTPR